MGEGQTHGLVEDHQPKQFSCAPGEEKGGGGGGWWIEEARQGKRNGVGDLVHSLSCLSMSL